MNNAARFIEESAMRTFIRHPSDIPIAVEIADVQNVPPETDMLRDISIGGLSFHCDHTLDINQVIAVKIPFIEPHFSTRGRVVWCQLMDDERYDIGIEFVDRHDLFQMRMIEQICHIEHYKREVQTMEGRQLSGQQAALEWIQKYADRFPTMNEPRDP